MLPAAAIDALPDVTGIPAYRIDSIAATVVAHLFNLARRASVHSEDGSRGGDRRANFPEIGPRPFIRDWALPGTGLILAGGGGDLECRFF